MFKTRITEMFGIEYPIIQGALMWLSRAELVAAVSNAGGLGILAALTFPTPQELREEIKKTKKKIKVNQEQLRYEFKWLCQKLKKRSPHQYRLIATEKKIVSHPFFQLVEGPIESWERTKV